VQKSEIKPNTEYAFREKRSAAEPLQRVRVLQHVRPNKWKVQWIDPNPGLTDYVESGQLVAPWSEQKAFLKEEADSERFREHNDNHGYSDEESPTVTAMHEVFDRVADDVNFHRGSITASREALARFMARAGIAELPKSPVAYTGRDGTIHLPFDVALELARKFCAAEPHVHHIAGKEGPGLTPIGTIIIVDLPQLGLVLVNSRMRTPFGFVFNPVRWICRHQNRRRAVQ
jgi:hypothetical protein